MASFILSAGSPSGSDSVISYDQEQNRVQPMRREMTELARACESVDLLYGMPCGNSSDALVPLSIYRPHGNS